MLLLVLLVLLFVLLLLLLLLVRVLLLLRIHLICFLSQRVLCLSARFGGIAITLSVAGGFRHRESRLSNPAGFV